MKAYTSVQIGQNRQLDFSMFPNKATKSFWSSPLSAFIIAIITITLMVGIPAVIFIITRGNYETPLLITNLIAVTAFIGIICFAFIKLFNNASNQKKYMKMFAAQNGFVFEDGPTTIDETYLAPGLTLSANRSAMRFCVYGMIDERDFQLYSLIGRLNTPNGEILNMPLTILRTHDNDGIYAYEIDSGGLGTRQSLSGLFMKVFRLQSE